MKKINNEEKSIKRYLKNHISLNLETIVKFLITGVIGISLTACGGGGGGGSSSDSKPPVVGPEDPKPEPPIVEEVEVNKNNEGHTINGKDTNISGVIKGDATSKNIVGITAKNSNVESKATINLSGDGSVGMHGTTDLLTASTRANYSIKNSGTIEISGKNSVGISVENGVVGINNGTIIGTGEGVYQQNQDGTTIENSIGSTGILAKNGSKGINNKDIILEGAYTSGMIAKDKSIVENNGNISVKSKLVEESELSEGEYYKGIVYSTEKGLVADNGSHAVNNGLITGQGNVRGIEVTNGSKGENNGEIQLESLRKDGKTIIESGEGYVILQDQNLSKVRGLRGRDKNSIVINNKNIKLSGYAVGIEVDKEAKGINNGNIQLVSQEVASRGYSKGGTPNGEYDWVYKEIGVTYSELIGMLAKNGDIENSKTGTISLDGTGVGMKATSNSKGINNGNIIVQSKAEVWSDTADINDPDPTTGEWLFWAPMAGMEADGSEITNNNKIQVINDGQGMKALNNSVATNNGDIIITSKTSNETGEPIGWDYHVIGMELKDSVGANNGNIVITGSAEHKGVFLDKGANFINKGKIEVETENSFARGISEDTYKSEVLEKGIVNDGSIRVYASKIGGEESNSSLGDAIGVTVNRDFINNGEIYTETKGGTAVGIDSRVNKRSVMNSTNGKIIVVGDNAIGIKANNETYGSSEILGKVSVTNDGLIAVNGKTGDIEYRSEIVTGIQSFNYNEVSKGLITNNGKIEIESLDDARGIDSYGNDVINNGIISVKGTGTSGGVDLNGIRVQGLGATATNNGTINVDGLGAWGMYAGIDGTAINSKDGVINVSATAEGGMIASGGTAINYGTINIGIGNSNTDIVELDKNGNEVIKSAMYATNGGTIENYGTINSNGNLTLGSSNGGVYMIGTSEDGSYGKITAKNVSIDGDVVVSAGITKNGFKNEYTMQNVIDAEDITLGDNFNFTSNSLLYDAEAVTDRWGNLDATLNRNNKTLSDFTTGYITSTADIFGKYQNEETFKTLSSDAKEVVKAIDTSSAEAIDRSLNDLTPTIYSNLGRQILETSETFKEQDMVAINSLGENSYNFTFIGEYQDIDSRDNIEGYKSKLSGFVGAMSFGDGTFGTIGYGYNDIDYKDNGKGHIQTIHLGLNRFMKYQGVDFRLGLGGEYNFHENKRDMDLVSRRAESDFDSYGVRASGEVSKVFGEKAFVKPYLGFDLAHMKYDSFTESNANSLNAIVESENYTSVLPKIGLLVGDRFGGLNLFAGVEYSYELGNMDKEQEFGYEGFSGKGKLPKDDLECGTTGVKAGASYEVNNFTLGASVGKNFGRRDNSFVNVSIGYRF
ncbi:MAG: autotransporter outer membrane beta-barrel domain-containing protein [Cetobacterium sp.]|uniref:autotransporter outer membrane beta-barrel domain-containing protein n=1 Tax=Cetobacterium sp. TaxID=2071632 RepID=UPI003F3D4B8D